MTSAPPRNCPCDQQHKLQRAAEQNNREHGKLITVAGPRGT